MTLLKALEQIKADLEALGLKEATANFSCYFDNIFVYRATTNLSMYSDLEPTRVELSIIADDSFMAEMPFLDILNSKRIHFIEATFWHQDTEETNTDIHFDDNWKKIWSTRWVRYNEAELN